MTRWLWAVAASAFVGVAAGQGTPPPMPRDGDTYTFRTAGQPERKVKVLRVTSFADGESLADVQDAATGAKYTIPTKVLAAAARSVSRAPEAVSATPPAAPPAVKQTAFPTNLKPPAGAPYAARKPAGTTGTAILHGLGADQRPQAPPAAVTYPAAGSAPPAVAVPESPLRMPPLAQLKPLLEPAPVPETRPAPTVVVEPPVPDVQHAAPTAPPPIPAAPPPVVTASLSEAVAQQLADETTPLLRDLYHALMPSVRERAATALAEGRHGWRPEVKAHLVKAAAEDPAPAVRAHCVGLLSQLGYHESAYLDHLGAWAASGPPAVKKAAAAALAKLSMRN